MLLPVWLFTTPPERAEDGLLAGISHLCRATADGEDGIPGDEVVDGVGLPPEYVLDVDLIRLVPGKSGEYGQGRILVTTSTTIAILAQIIPLLLEEEVLGAVPVAEEEEHGSRVGVREPLVDEAPHGGEAGARGHGDERALGVLGAVDGREDWLVADAQAGVGGKGGEIAGAEALAWFAEDGAVADEGDEELYAGDALVAGGMGEEGSSVGDAEVTAADEGEDVEKTLGGDLD